VILDLPPATISYWTSRADNISGELHHAYWRWDGALGGRVQIINKCSNKLNLDTLTILFKPVNVMVSEPY